MAVPQDALSEVARFCEERTPGDLRDKVRLECSVRGNTITIVERRAPWNPSFGMDWTTSEIAQPRHDARRETWSLHWRGSDERWHPYEGVRRSHNVGLLIAEIGADPTRIFWG
jgi:hypothetical protein